MTPADVKTLHADVLTLRDRYLEAADRLHRAVAAALTDGHSAIDIADTLGVTRARVYQLRNKAREQP